MPNLINHLRQEHNELKNLFEKLGSADIGSGKGQATLSIARETLLAHLKKKDELLYRRLFCAARIDSLLRDRLNNFAKDMMRISVFAAQYFDRYRSGGSSREFALDTGRLTGMLTNQICREETILYKYYEGIAPAG